MGATRRLLARGAGGAAVLALAATAAVAPSVVTGAASTTPAHASSALERVVHALAVDSPQVPALPGGFVDVLGYRPTRTRSPEARWVNPDGGCSVSTGSTSYGFGAACKAHDLGYDVLRYAARTGHPLGAGARREIDERFAHAMNQRCRDIGDPAGCTETAWVYAEGVRFNTWRQSGSVPLAETAGQWWDHLGAAVRTSL